MICSRSVEMSGGDEFKLVSEEVVERWGWEAKG